MYYFKVGMRRCIHRYQPPLPPEERGKEGVPEQRKMRHLCCETHRIIIAIVIGIGALQGDRLIYNNHKEKDISLVPPKKLLDSSRTGEQGGERELAPKGQNSLYTPFWFHPVGLRQDQEISLSWKLQDEAWFPVREAMVETVIIGGLNEAFKRHPTLVWWFDHEGRKWPSIQGESYPRDIHSDNAPESW